MMKQKQKRKRMWLTYGLFAAVVLAAYFINVEVQTYLGEKALEQSGLSIHDLDEALLEARAESKLILADLSAIWCPSCRKLDKKVLSDPEVKRDIEKRFVFVRVEYESDQGKAFMDRYGVSGFPNLLILDADGRLVKKLPLTFDPEVFRRHLVL